MQGNRYKTVLAAALVAGVSFPTSAQDVSNFPVKPVRVITSQAQGGATDVQARMYAQKLSQELRRQFIVENLPGAGGIAGVGAVAKAVPDGYTLLTITSTFTITPALRNDLPFDPIKDFTPISLVSRAPYWLCVNAAVPAKSVKELVALARAHPGKLNFGAGNIGSGTHLAVLYFFLQAKVKGTYIPYKGVGQAMIDLIGGQIDGTFSGPLSMAPHVKSGKLRALGTTTAQRSKAYPELPTIVEQGVDFVFITFHGWLAPAGTPGAIVNKLSTELAKAVNSPEIAEKLKAEGVEPVGSTPEELRQIIASEVPRWRKLIQDTGIKPE